VIDDDCHRLQGAPNPYHGKSDAEDHKHEADYRRCDRILRVSGRMGEIGSSGDQDTCDGKPESKLIQLGNDDRGGREGFVAALGGCCAGFADASAPSPPAP
jgi:hypothetical protein